LLSKKSILFTVSVLCFSFGFSQNDHKGNFGNGGDMPAIGKIKGIVLDKSKGLPIEFATVGLFKKKDSTLITGAVANEKGEFLLENIPFGRFFLKANFIGYKEIVIDTIKIKPPVTEIDLGKIKLSSTSENLNEVEVEADKGSMQLSIDKKVFNVTKDLINSSGSATDVLQNIPSVSVDIDGNISLRGSGNVTVLVDGKPSGITGSSRQAILSQIPASSIESVEIITNPSAKYDPDGMSGIINIVLKKNKANGFNGSISAGVGTFDKYNASLNLSYRNKHMNVYVNYGYRANHRTGSGYSNRQNILSDTTFYVDNSSNSIKREESHNAKAGLDFYINDKNTIGASVMYGSGRENNIASTRYYEFDNTHTMSGDYWRDVPETNHSMNLDYNLNYRKTFNKPKQELTFDATYSDASSNEKQNFDERDYSLKFAPLNLTPLRQVTDNIGKNGIFTGQLDYTQPLKKGGKFETGYKIINRNIGNDYVSTTYNYVSDNFLPDTAINNNFKYTEQIHAVYGTFSSTIKNFGYQLGLRAEEALTDANLVTTSTNYKNNYFSLFPSVHLSEKLKKEQEIQLSYSRRINRPNTRSLNPFKDYEDPYNVRYGNPYLKPEYINSYELSYLKFWKKTALTATAYYRQTNGIVQRIKTIGDSTISYVTFVNLNSSTSYGIELIDKSDLLKWWNITASFNFFQNIINGKNVDADLQNENISYTGKLLSNMKVWKTMDIQFSANYMGPTATAQGIVKPVFTMDIGLKKDFLKNQLSIGLGVTDITNARKMAITASGSNFNLEFERRRESRVATLTVTYRFGKMAENGKKGKQDRQGGGMDNGGGDMGM
jgi:iron complex outermembrane receptor protein